MHPIYKYMVGDTVKNVGPDYSKKKFFVAHEKKPFIIKKASQFFVAVEATSESDAHSRWESYYTGIVKNLRGYGHDEDELCTCRMVLLEKALRFVD